MLYAASICLLEIEKEVRYKKYGKFYVLKPKGMVQWQFENLQKFKHLYGRPRECDWWPKRLLPIQILLISNVHTNSPLKDINLKI